MLTNSQIHTAATRLTFCDSKRPWMETWGIHTEQSPTDIICHAGFGRNVTISDHAAATFKALWQRLGFSETTEKVS